MKNVFLLVILLLLLSCQKDELILTDTLNDEIALSTRSAFPDLLPLPIGFQPEGIVNLNTSSPLI